MKRLAAILILLACNAHAQMDGFALWGGAGGTSFTPASVSNIVLWYNASAIMATNGQVISSWQTSVGSFALTNAAANSPSYTNSTSIGGKPWVYFGASNYLFNSAETYLPQPLYIFVIAYTETDTSYINTFFAANDRGGAAFTNDFILFKGIGSSSNTLYYENRGLSGHFTAPTNLAHSWYLFEIDANAGLSAVWTNGIVAVTNITASMTNSLRGLSFGTLLNPTAIANSYLRGGIAEFVLYTNAITSGSRQLLHTYFTNKYGAFGTWGP